VFTDYVFDAFTNKNQVDVIYTDFSKVFDRVNHVALIKVHATNGFGEPLLWWFRSYSSDRKQFVEIFGIKSLVLNTPPGVHQGGHLCLILYTLFINSIKKVIPHSKFLLFADDFKLFLEIRSVLDCHVSQSDLNALELTHFAWAVDISLDFNVSKCCSQSFYRIRTYLEFKYSLQGTLLLKEIL